MQEQVTKKKKDANEGDCPLRGTISLLLSFVFCVLGQLNTLFPFSLKHI